MLIIIFFSIIIGIITSKCKADNPVNLNNLDSMCQNIYNGFSIYGKKLQRYNFDQSCTEFRGLGESVMKKFSNGDLCCYKDLSSALCSVQFVEYEPSVTCSATNELFIRILEICNKKNMSFNTYSHCASWEPVNRLVEDPDVFCKNSYITVSYENDANSSNSDMKTFGDLEQLDCKRLAENYNTCMLIAVKKLGYSEKFCQGGGFTGYCRKYPNVVNDANFKFTCENIIIPYLMETHRERVEGNQCVDIYDKYLMYLSFMKAGALSKANAAKFSLDSMRKGIAIFDSFRSFVAQAVQKSTEVSIKATNLFNRIQELSQKGMAFDSISISKFHVVSLTANQLDEEVKSLVLPDSIGENDYQKLRLVNQKIEATVELQTTLLQLIDELFKLMEIPGHVSFAQLYGFFPIDFSAIQNLNIILKTQGDTIDSFAKNCNDLMIELPELDSSFVSRFEQTGKKYTQLADMYSEQTKLLRNIISHGSNTESPIAEAMKAFT